MVSFLNIPDEILIIIMTYVDIYDVLNLRKTCKRCFHLTHERSIWEAIIRAQARLYPLPHLLDANSVLQQETAGTIEELSASVHLTAISWLRHRQLARSLQAGPGSHNMPVSFSTRVRSIQDMHMLLDRWLIVVFQEAGYEVWDLYSSEDPGHIGLSRKGTWAREKNTPICVLEDPAYERCLSSIACLDPADGAIILVLCNEPVTTILRIDVKPRSPESRIVAAVTRSPFSMQIIRAIEPTSKILVFSFATNLHIWHWPTDSYWQVKLEEGEGEIYNMILAAHFLSPHHLVCLQRDTVDLMALDFLQEVHDVPMSCANKTLHEHTLQFRGTVDAPHIRLTNVGLAAHLRGAVFSRPQTTYSEDGSKTVSSTFLAYDVLRGLFLYAIDARFPNCPEPPTPPVPARTVTNPVLPLDVNVTLLTAHHMAQLDPLADVSSGQIRAPRSLFTPGARGYISACALGSQGKRGIWAERHRASMGRSVYGFVASNEGSVVTTDEAPQLSSIHGTCIHEVRHSYDLRGPDDLTHCAFSEITGTVILGTRRGDIVMI